jgi:tellurite resistance protein
MLPNPFQSNNMFIKKLAYFPIGLFASVMGVAGLALIWAKAAELYAHEGDFLWIEPVALVLRGMASALLIILVLSYGIKFVGYRAAVIEEFKHPIKLNFFAAIPIGLILLATLWSSSHLAVANTLWWIGVVLMLVATLVTMSSWLHHDHYQLNHLNPAWFIPVVGNVLIPIGGLRLGHLELSWFFFSIGIVFWLILMTIVINRLIFHDPLADRLKPTLFILLAPPAVGFLAYVALNGGALDAFARVLFYTGLFLALLLFSNAARFLRLPFFVSGWAYSFPVAAMGMASFRMYELTNLVSFQFLGWIFLVGLSVIVTYLIFKTLQALFSGNLLVPEAH